MPWRLVSVVVACFAIGALIAAAVLLEPPQPVATQQMAAGKSLIGGPFTLIDHTGKTVTEKDYAGKYRLMFFGFTHCPDICPAELQVMAAALDRLGPEADRVVPIFVSVDPARDTPERLAEYVGNFGPRFVGLTGTPEQVAAAAKAFRVYFAKVEDPGSRMDYSVDHSAIAYLMSPENEYVTHFTYGTTPEKMAGMIKAAIESP